MAMTNMDDSKALAYLERELARARRKLASWQERCEVLEGHLRQWRWQHEGRSEECQTRVREETHGT